MERIEEEVKKLILRQYKYRLPHIKEVCKQIINKVFRKGVMRYSARFKRRFN